MSKDNIPNTDSIQELAEFWDTHDLTECEDELVEASEPVFARETVVRLQLPKPDADAVEKIAKAQGIDSADLIRRWVLERVQKSA